MPVILYPLPSSGKPVNKALKTFLFNQLDEIPESKNEIGSHEFTGNIMSQKLRTGIMATILINRLCTFVSC